MQNLFKVAMLLVLLGVLVFIGYRSYQPAVVQNVKSSHEAPAAATSMTREDRIRELLPPSAPATFEHHNELLAANPSDIHFTIALEGKGDNKFVMGEPIKLRYQFTADTPGTYVSGARCESGSRNISWTLSSKIDTFVVDQPEYARDPVRDFWDFYSALFCTEISLKAEPSRKIGSETNGDVIDISRRLQFRRPGKYELFAITRQVVPANLVEQLDKHKYSTKECFDVWLDPSLCLQNPIQPIAPLTSANKVTFEVLPNDEAADKQAIDSILAAAGDSEHIWLSEDDAFRLYAINTPEARHAAAQLYGRSYRNVDYILLSTILSAPPGAEPLMLLEERLQDRRFPIDATLLDVIAALNFFQRERTLTGDAIRRASPGDTDTLRGKYAQELLSVTRKAMMMAGGRSQENLSKTMLALTVNTKGNICTPPIASKSEDQQNLRLLNVMTLPDLPPNQQLDRLQNFYWFAYEVPRETVLAQVGKVYQQALAAKDDPRRKAALGQIARLDAYKALAMLKRELLDYSVPIDTAFIHDLGLEKNMMIEPEWDISKELSRMLKTGRPEDYKRAAPMAGVLGFKISPLEHDAKTFYEKRGEEWPCSVQAGMLAYFMRNNPKYAKEKLGPAIKASDAREQDDCVRETLLADLHTMSNPSESSEIVLDELQSRRYRLVLGAAKVASLTHSGGKVRDALIERLRELGHDRKESTMSQSDRIMEYALADAISAVPYDNEREALYKEVNPLCLTDSCRKRLHENLLERRVDQFGSPLRY